MKDRLLAILIWACFGWLVGLVLVAALAGAGENTMPGERPMQRPGAAAKSFRCLAVGPTTCDPGSVNVFGPDKGFPTFAFSAFGTTVNRYPILSLHSARGTASAPTAVQSGDIIARMASPCGYDGTTYCAAFGASDTDIRAVAEGTYTASSHPARLEFYTTPTGTTSSTKVLSIRQDGTCEQVAKTTVYNNIATVGNGVPAEYATIDTTGLTANVGSTLLYAVPSTGAGLYRVTALVVETTAASVSSTLANVQIVYTDNQTSGTVTIDATPVLGVAGVGQTGALTANTVGTTSTGVIAVNAKASTNINYQTVNYGSSAAGMTYALHIRLEAL